MHGMKLRLWTVLALAGLVLGSGQLAAGESPWQVGLRFGESQLEARFGSSHPKSFDDEAEAGSVDVSYALNRHLAVQAGYHDLGSFDGFGSPCRQGDDACIERILALCADGPCTELVMPLAADVTGLSLALVPSWPLGERVSLRGKVGLMAWDSEVDVLFVPESFERFSGEDLLTGVGLEYLFPSGFGVTADYEQLDLDASAARLGVSWRF